MISIHAPREGSDIKGIPIASYTGISIHAPREGSDKDKLTHSGHLYDFNPRSP